MVIWTKDFETHKGSAFKAKSFIKKSIAAAQTAFSKSKIGATIEVVHMARDDRFIQTGVEADMRLMNQCKKTNFCETRSKVKAHIAVAFTSKGGLSGAAFKGPNPSLRSAVLGKAASTNTLAHEIGHLFGCKEDRQTEEDDNLSTDPCTNTFKGFGYRSSDSKWRDLMSMNCVVGKYDCSIRKKIATKCKLMEGHYGDPDIKYNGVPTGSKKNCCACHMRDSVDTIVNKMPVKR